MKPSTFFGADYARMFREQFSHRDRARGWEQVALRASSGATAGARRTFDPAGQKRAAASFGLVGDELCACEESTCDTCSCAGKVTRCGCGVVGCGACTAGMKGEWMLRDTGNPLSASGIRVAASGAVARALSAGPKWSLLTAARTRDKPLETILEEWPGAESAAGISPRYFCAHSHMDASTSDDWERTIDPSAQRTRSSLGLRTETERRIDRLASLQEHGVYRAVVSTLHKDPDKAMEGAVLDDITAFAADEYPDFVVPFARGFSFEDTDADDYMRACLRSGFMGVGELFVHGYGDRAEVEDAAQLVNIASVCRVAADRGVPVAVHWEIGNREEPSDDGRYYTSANESFRQLWELLIDVNSRATLGAHSGLGSNQPLKLILCHAGSGPRGADKRLVPLYLQRLDWLLAVFPDVYFDLAGLQREPAFNLYKPADDFGNPDQLTYLGEGLADRMKDPRWQHRFLFGIDTEVHDAGEFEKWVASIPNYARFLELAGIDSALAKKFYSDNAEGLLYG